MLILNEHNASPRDLYQIQHFTNLVKIDLSFNKLSRFPVGFSFRVFVRLRILMLHYNKFSNLKNLLVVSEVSLGLFSLQL